MTINVRQNNEILIYNILMDDFSFYCLSLFVCTSYKIQYTNSMEVLVSVLSPLKYSLYNHFQSLSILNEVQNIFIEYQYIKDKSTL